MPRTSYWIQRSKRHFILAAAAVAIVALAYAATPPPDVRHRLSMATAYAGLVFLAVSLWLGPWNVLRQRPNFTSFDFRRDVGIWTGILAIVHTAIGLTVHLRGRMWMYFFKGLHPLKLQNTQFGFANFTGLGAALLFLMLLAISNDLSLRTLKARRWKLSAKMDVYSVPADRGTCHCVSTDREAPCPLGSCLGCDHGSGCCCSISWLCPGSQAVACSDTPCRTGYQKTGSTIMTPSLRKLVL